MTRMRRTRHPRHPVSADTSQYQTAYNSSYPRHIRIFRATFGAHYLDPRFLENANDTARAYAAGECVGAFVYTVWLNTASPAEQFAFFWEQFGNKVPDWLIGPEIDAETWNGTSYEQHGDHSAELNKLYGLHAHKMGAWTAVLGYGNAGNLAELWPHRDKRVLIDEAHYGPTLGLTVPGAIAQQYTDGQTKWGIPAGYPHTSKPFGACDHNAFLGVRTAAELRAALRPLHTQPGDGSGDGSGGGHTPKHHRPRPYPAPAVRSAGAIIGAGRQTRVTAHGGQLIVEYHGKRVWTSPDPREGAK